MTTTVNLKRILDRKQWELLAQCPTGTNNGSCTAVSKLPDQWLYFLNAASVIYAYDPAEDGWIAIPASGSTGTYGAGACLGFHPMRPPDTATGGSTTTIQTSITAARSMKGYKVRVIAGPGAGDERTITSNTIGANAVFTVDVAFSAAITAASVVEFQTGSLYFFNAGTMSASTYRRYDVMTNVWASLSTTAGPASWGVEGNLVATPSLFATFDSSTATGGGASTLDDAAKAWTVNQWANSQVRITAGTGAGQKRSISSNTGVQLTVGTAWTIVPDATSVYVIEGNDDYLYLTGNNGTTFYRYSISGNSWTTLTARGGGLNAGGGTVWVHSVSDPTWTDVTAIKNGRYLYSWRGGATATLDVYDIAANSWSSAAVHAPTTETFTTGSGIAYKGDAIYLHKDATGRWFKFDIASSWMRPWSHNWVTQSTAQVGGRVQVIDYVDGSTTLSWVVAPGNNQVLWHRCLIF